MVRIRTVSRGDPTSKQAATWVVTQAEASSRTEMTRSAAAATFDGPGWATGRKR